MINDGDKAPNYRGIQRWIEHRAFRPGPVHSSSISIQGRHVRLQHREAQDFTELAGDFAKAGAKVVGVSRDAMKKHEKFIDKYALKVPLASDEDGAISDAFRHLGRKVDVRS
jgi:hypothetical protein